MLEKISNINPQNIKEEDLRNSFCIMLNIIEEQQKQIKEQDKLIQSLKDKILILKKEQAKPTFPTKKKSNNTNNISSDKYTKEEKTHNKTSKKASLKIDERNTYKIDKSELPEDAIFKGYDTLIQQDIIFKRKNTEFKVEKWYSPSNNKIYRAKPEGYEGYFGNSLKSFVLVMHHYGDITRSKILGILESMGVEISTGSLQNILTENKEIWIEEKRDILKAGLSSSFTQTDTTGAKVAGETWRSHIICTDKFTVFSTLQGKSRKDLLYALQGEPDSGLMLSYNQETEKYLDHFKISKKYKEDLSFIFNNTEPINELEFRKKINELLPGLASKPTIFNWVCDSFAFGYYIEQQEFPQVDILISDDAPEYKLIGNKRGLCWIHDARYYNKLTPFVDCHKKVLSDFKNDYWDFYRSLKEYKKEPDKMKKNKLELEFDKLFIPDKIYFDLNKAIERTRENKKELLAVLTNPEIPLHNNLSELHARQQVRKRDICLHTMTRLGTQLQDAFMSIIHTCKLVSVNPFSYISGKISNENKIHLPELILSMP